MRRTLASEKREYQVASATRRSAPPVVLHPGLPAQRQVRLVPPQVRPVLRQARQPVLPPVRPALQQVRRVRQPVPPQVRQALRQVQQALRQARPQVRRQQRLEVAVDRGQLYVKSRGPAADDAVRDACAAELPCAPFIQFP
jgi:hypothetical protein